MLEIFLYVSVMYSLGMSLFTCHKPMRSNINESAYGNIADLDHISDYLVRQYYSLHKHIRSHVKLLFTIRITDVI